jgi:hypothetical protein
MGREHQALIHWSLKDLVRATGDPPDHRRGWFPRTGLATGDAWSLVCDFVSPPRVQGSPSLARARFLADEVPPDRLGRGITLQPLDP